jgi:hypothetical protein
MQEVRMSRMQVALNVNNVDEPVAAGLTEIEILSDKGFGTVALTMVPEPMQRQAQAEGIDVQRVADTVRSLTVRARKPQSA